MKKMLKINSLILILIVMFNMLFPVLLTAAEETVTITFKDQNLYNAILTQLEGKIGSSNETTYTITITKSNLEAITELNLASKKIEDISGIEKFTALTNLNLNNNSISNIESLSTLTTLNYLNLHLNNVSDIAPLSNLTQLETLYLNNNYEITNIEPLSSLGNLTYLALSENKISDITPLSHLTNLETLWLNSNEITNIEPLSTLTTLKNLFLSNNAIKSLESISNLETLISLGAYNTQISDISFLRNLTNIHYLLLSNNNITDISEIANLKELVTLSLCGNPNLKDVSALTICTKLEKLYLHNDDIEDISQFNTLVNLKELGVGGNKIKDLSVIDKLSALELTNEWQTTASDIVETVPSNYQTIEMILNKTEAENKIDLPQIFIKAKDENSKLHTEEEFELANCTLSSDGEQITLNENVNEATVTLKGGPIADSKLIIKVNDGVAPVLDVKYSTTNPTNKGVTATITSNKELQELEGWNLSEDKLSLTKGYTQNTEEEITVQDFAGNEAKTKIVINNIDVTAPELDVKYSTTDTTKNPVTVTVTSNEKLKPVNGWNLSEDQLILTKEYSKNVEEELIAYDLSGNERKIPIRIANIDVQDLKVEVEYSKTVPTKETVKATIKANKKIQPVEGWTLDTDGVNLTKTYAQNIEEEVTVKDLAGNEAKVTVRVNNIDIDVPQAEIKYSTTEETKESVTVTITSNEKLEPVSGWNLSQDQLVLTKEYFENVEEEVTIKDLAGNEIKIPIKIENIDMVDLEVEAECSTTELTKETVKVTIKANKAIKPIEGWILEEDGVTLTKVYTKNVKEEITVKDLAGNEKKVIITIDNIDTTAPEVEVKYSTTKTTTGGVKVEIVANEKLQELEGWELSQDKLTLTKTYTQNKEEEVTIKDLVGNERKVSIEVKNIEEVKDTEKGDNTTADSPIPQTGKTITIIASITVLILISIAEYLKLKKFKGIK